MRAGIDRRLWAKTCGDDGRYPVIAHLLDTAAAARAVCTWSSAVGLERLAASAGTTPDVVAGLIVHAAAVHDIGKINPEFQGQRGSPRFACDLAALTADGFPQWNVSRWCEGDQKLVRRHEIASGVAVRPELFVPTSCSLVAEGHHGQWQLVLDEESEFDIVDDEVLDVLGELRDPEAMWGGQIAAHLSLVAEVVGAAPDVEVPVAVVPLAASLVTLADWIASDEHAVEVGRRLPAYDGDDWDAFYQDRLRWFEKRVPDALGTVRKPSLATAFPFDLNRDVQVKMLDPDAVHPGSGLTVVAVPPGEGKTEAAFARIFASCDPGSGVFFALPTMATADAMFARIREMFDGTGTLGSLSHGRAVLNSFYDDAETVPTVGRVWDDTTKGLRPGDWFEGRHRALLAPVAVGTVDQLLSGMLRHRYNMMRVAGVMSKTVVLDEVHSYDMRLTALTEQFLEWAGFLGIDVVLLSATLPAVRLRGFVGAYERGAGRSEPPVEPQYPGIVSVAGGELRQAAVRCREIDVALQVVRCGKDERADVLTGEVERLRAEHPEAKIGVMTNTVRRAQQVGARFPDAVVLHSRFPAVVRAELTDQAIRDYGKASGPGAALLVGSPVLEQSIDVDFDVLVTELCPATSLVQRFGRVWRHSLDGRDRKRPPGLDVPTVVIVDCGDDSSPYVHAPYLTAQILKTRAALEPFDGTFSVPGDVQGFVDEAEVVDADVNGPFADDALRKVVDDCAAIARADRDATPSPRRLQEPADLVGVASGVLDEQIHQTRISDTATVTVLAVSPEPQPGCWTGSVPERPSRQEVRGMLECTVPLSGGDARKILDLADSGALRRLTGGHRLLEGIVVLPVNTSEAPADCSPHYGMVLR